MSQAKKLAARFERTELTLKVARPHTFVPYVYKKPEIVRLLRAAKNKTARRNPVIKPEPFQMILLLLYATGATQAELLSLKRQDVRLGNKLIFIHNSQYNTGRKIPISDDLRDALKKYVSWRCARREALLFVNRNGQKIAIDDLIRRFKTLCKATGTTRSDGHIAHPRLRDMRHTFAVHRITAWIESGADLSVMMPALAAYLGLANLLSSERYLCITPARFQKHLDSLSPLRSKNHWRDDTALMGFLASV